jgi:hypothetical protein
MTHGRIEIEEYFYTETFMDFISIYLGINVNDINDLHFIERDGISRLHCEVYNVGFKIKEISCSFKKNESDNLWELYRDGNCVGRFTEDEYDGFKPFYFNTLDDLKAHQFRLEILYKKFITGNANIYDDDLVVRYIRSIMWNNFMLFKTKSAEQITSKSLLDNAFDITFSDPNAYDHTLYSVVVKDYFKNNKIIVMNSSLN